MEKTEQNIEFWDDGIIWEGDDDNFQPSVIYIYNSVRRYVSSIPGFCSHQIFWGFYRASEPHRVTIEALVMQSKYLHQRKEYTDSDFGLMKNEYL